MNERYNQSTPRLMFTCTAIANMADVYVFEENESEDVQNDEEQENQLEVETTEITDKQPEEIVSPSVDDGTQDPSEQSKYESIWNGVDLMMLAVENNTEDMDRCADPKDEYNKPLLSPFERFVACSKGSTYFDRNFASKSIYESLRYAVESKPEMVPYVLDCMSSFLEAADCSLRTDLMEQVPQIAFLCDDHQEQLGDVMSFLLIPKVMAYLSDPHEQVRKTTQAALLVLLEQELITRTDVDEKVCSGIMDILSTSDDNLRTEVSALVSKMVPLLKPGRTQTMFVEKYPIMSKDTSFAIRKICASNIVEFANAAGRSITEDILLPQFIELCRDNIWGVRKTCAEVITQIACCVSLVTRRNVLAPAYQVLLRDHSRWVRLSAYQSLGMFLSTFADPSKTGLMYNSDGTLSISEPSSFDSGCVVASPLSNVLPQESEYNELNYWKSPLPDIDVPADLLETPDPIVEKVVTEDSVVSELSECVDWSLMGTEQNSEADSGLEDEEGSDDVTPAPSYASVVRGNCNLEKSKSNTVLLLNEFEKEENEQDTTSPPSNYSSDESLKQTVPSVQGAGTYSFFFGSFQAPSLSLPLTIDQDIIPSPLLLEFINLSDPHRLEIIDAEITRDCAYSFPGVALALGRHYWSGLLPTYRMLVSDLNWKVRRTLAFSIHELARILGQEIAERDLYPVFQDFTRDLDEIRLGVLRHLSEFLQVLSSEYRVKFLPEIFKFLRQDNTRDWRFRLELAEQLVPLSELFSHEDCYNFICPVAFKLLDGKVAHIRKVCYSVLSQLAYKLSLDPDHAYLTNFSKRLCTHFAEVDTWLKRQSFVYVAGQILDDNSLTEEVWSKHFLQSFLKLSKDPVPNVRLAVSRVISTVLVERDFNTQEFNEEYKMLVGVLVALRLDVDRDVKYFAVCCSDDSEIEVSTHDTIE